MSWAKLDDNFWMHPKVMMAGNAAAGVFARLLSYCGCYLTDGMIPSAVVQTIEGKDRGAVRALHEAGMIDLLESGGVIIPDYLEHNRSKAQVEADRKQRQEAGRRGGKAKSSVGQL